MTAKISRRKFLDNTMKAGFAAAGSKLFLNGIGKLPGDNTQFQTNYNARGLPTAMLGKTGVAVPRITMGLGSRFLTIKSEDEALEMCTYALDNGLYYWDTAHSYVNNETGATSEERLGLIVKNRRKEIFLSTKIAAREADMAKAQIELSLKRLQTDHLDMLKIHAVETPEDVDNICKKGGVLDLVSSMKQQGITRFIGFSGHSNAIALRKMIETGRFDSMLFAMNHYDQGKNDRQGIVIPSAREKGMGIMLMKTVRPKETMPGINAADLVRYALSLDGPAGITVGMDSKKVVDANLAILRNFKPMTPEEKAKFTSILEPFFRGNSLYWMQSGYRDGHWG
jgi:hypothetical protein